MFLSQRELVIPVPFTHSAFSTHRSVCLITYISTDCLQMYKCLQMYLPSEQKYKYT